MYVDCVFSLASTISFKKLKRESFYQNLIHKMLVELFEFGIHAIKKIFFLFLIVLALCYLFENKHYPHNVIQNFYSNGDLRYALIVSNNGKTR